LEFCTHIVLSEPYLRYVLWVEIPCFRQICSKWHFLSQSTVDNNSLTVFGSLKMGIV
jgi:hypothetical protein